MRFILIILLSLFFFTDDPIIWEEDSRLEWVNFKGKVPENRGLKVALSRVEIVMEGNAYENEVPDIEINAYFMENKSWTTVNDCETLEHEQLHFDIAELYARKIRKKVDSLVINDVTDFSIYTSIYKTYLLEHRKFQKLYDSEVYFNDGKQIFWINKVRDELKALNKFKN